MTRKQTDKNQPRIVIEKSDAPATLRFHKDGSVTFEQESGEDLRLERVTEGEDTER